MSKAKPGEKITIKINGKPVETIIDEDGKQRFPNNKIISYMVRGNDFFNLDKMWRMIDIGMFSLEEARLIYQNNGYDICGYEKIFPADTIENPLKK